MEDFVVDFSKKRDKERLWDYLKGLKGTYVINFNSSKSQRSLQLNRYYWQILLEYIAKDTGHTPEECHEIFKDHFLPAILFDDPYDITTCKLTNEQMWDYVRKIRHWYKQFSGVEIPDPHNVIRPPDLSWSVGIENNFEKK